jgi:hypothetical protein
MLDELVSLREYAVTELQAQFKAGEVPDSAVAEARKKLAEAERRLKEFTPQ